DVILMRITDYFLVIPDVPLMIVVAAIWGPSLFHIVIVIGILLWTGTARVIRAQVKSVRERIYVKRARSLGAGHARILLRHVVPIILACSLLGGALEDALNPRLRVAHLSARTFRLRPLVGRSAESV